VAFERHFGLVMTGLIAIIMGGFLALRYLL
jgi:hypothetical protein